MKNSKIDKIPYLACDRELYNKLIPQLKKWGYKEVDRNLYKSSFLLIIDVDGFIGHISNSQCFLLGCDSNHYIETDVDKFLAKAAELMGKVYIKPHCLVSELPERIRRLAEARSRFHDDDDLYFNHVWEDSPEGYDFWHDLYEGRIPDNLEEVLTEFEKNTMEEKTLKMSVERARELHKQGGDIAKWIEENFSKEELNPLPKTWKEIEKHLSILTIEWIDKESNSAFKAFKKLERLRDCYRQGWKPDWKNEKYKFVIVNFKEKFEISATKNSSHFLSFQTKELTEEFFNNFKDLIKQAKELI